MELFQREQRQPKDSSGAGGPCVTAYLRLGSEIAYQRKAERAMTDENCFKIHIVSIPLDRLESHHRSQISSMVGRCYLISYS